MRFLVPTHPFLNSAAVAIAVGVLFSPSLPAQSTPAAKAVPPAGTTVQPASMQKLLPSPAGWTRGVVKAERAALSETTSYTFAYALYTNDPMKVRVTIADTGSDKGALAALATMIMTFPDNHVGRIPPATTIKRSVYKGSSAAELWDANSSDGEFTVVVGGRFVVKAEGTKLSDAAIPRTIVDSIDLQALAGLK